MKILIPMAGHSRRFAECGYTLPKAFLQVGDKPMIQHVVENFSPTDEFIFVVNADQFRDFPEQMDWLRTLAANVQITVIPPHENGPVYSAMQVSCIEAAEPFILNYCDFDMEWDYEAFLKLATSTDGLVAVFRGFQPASLGSTYFAYTRTSHDSSGADLLEVREKQSFTQDRTREFASTGTYYFGSFALFTQYAQELLQNPPMKEAYASLLYNLMVRDAKVIKVFEVDKFICLGTPADVDQYQLWWHTFEKNTSLAAAHPEVPIW